MEILNGYFVNCRFFSVPSHTKVFNDVMRGFPSYLFSSSGNRQLLVGVESRSQEVRDN